MWPWTINLLIGTPLIHSTPLLRASFLHITWISFQWSMGSQSIRMHFNRFYMPIKFSCPYIISYLPRPRKGLRGIVFTQSVCVCVRPIFWYFISRLYEEISIWNSYRILIGLYSIHWKKVDLHRSMVKVTGMVHCFLKVQSYHKNWAIENFQYLCVDTSLYALSNETIKTWRAEKWRHKKYVNIWRLTCKTPIPQ